jgi:hypothetical protein
LQRIQRVWSVDGMAYEGGVIGESFGRKIRSSHVDWSPAFPSAPLRALIVS